jgi:hypothetical protein
MPAGKLSNRLVQPGLTAVVGGGGAAPVETGITASGGTIGTYTANNETYRFHVFNSSGTFTVAAVGQTYNTVELLIAGGGQGAGPTGSGGDQEFGGAGAAVRYYGSEPKANTGMTPTGAAITTMGVGAYTVTVGGGGALGGTSGTASSFVGGSFNFSSPSGFSTTSGNPSSKTSYNNANFRGGVTGSDPVAGAGGAGCAGHGDGLTYRSDGAAASKPGNGGKGIWLGLTGTPLGFGGGGAGGMANNSYGFSQTVYRASGGAGAGDAGEASRVNSGAGGSASWNSLGRFTGASGCVIIRYRIY